MITLNRMLDELGVPISKEMLAEYTLYDLNSYDINIDWKITLDEISSLVRILRNTVLCIKINNSKITSIT